MSYCTRYVHLNFLMLKRFCKAGDVFNYVASFGLFILVYFKVHVNRLSMGLHIL